MKNQIIFLIPLFLIGAIVYFAFLSSAGFNPMSLDYKNAKLLYTIIPQGWGFFTRDPKEVQTLIYKKINGELALLNDSGAEPKYLFGLSRSTRRRNIEMAQIFMQIPDSAWITCESKDWKKCEPEIAQPVIDLFKYPQLSREYLIIKTRPIPWAWSKSYFNVKMPFEVCKIYVGADIHS